MKLKSSAKFYKNFKVKLVFTSEKWVTHFRAKTLIQLFSIQRLIINFLLLAVMLVMLVKHTDISQPGLMNTLVRIKNSHIYQHLMSSSDCLNACSRDCFTIVDTARTKVQLRIKESFFISWLKPNLNKQKSHQYIISLSIWLLLC